MPTSNTFPPRYRINKGMNKLNPLLTVVMGIIVLIQKKCCLSPAIITPIVFIRILLKIYLYI